MSSSEILNNLEIGGWSAIFLICAYGAYKLIQSRGLSSKCGIFQVDLRSKEARLLEINNKHELDLKKLEIEEMKTKAELLKYKHYNNEHSTEIVTKSTEIERDTGEEP